MQAADLFLGLALDLFGDLGDGLAAVALAGSHKAGKVAPVPVAETLLQQLLPLLRLFFSEGLGVCGGGGNLCRYSILAGTLQVQKHFAGVVLGLHSYARLVLGLCKGYSRMLGFQYACTECSSQIQTLVSVSCLHHSADNSKRHVSV